MGIALVVLYTVVTRQQAPLIALPNAASVIARRTPKTIAPNIVKIPQAQATFASTLVVIVMILRPSVSPKTWKYALYCDRKKHSHLFYY